MFLFWCLVLLKPGKMDTAHYRHLVQGYINKTLTDEELLVFTHLVREGKLDEYLKDAMNAEAGLTAADEPVFTPRKRVLPLWVRYAAAMLLLLLVTTAAWFLLHREAPVPRPVSSYQRDLQPGKNKAVLTLQGNRQIVLDDADSGLLAYQGNTALLKSKAGQLVYDAAKTPADAAMLNTLTTPMGAQYQLVLPDGSKVWLNAASSITFPAAFTGAERVVSITGEAYFEIAKIKQRGNNLLPFIVKTPQQTVKVLGTHFNINSYENEQSERTTLLEGSVQVSAAAQTVQLSPGQQAVVGNGKPTAVVSADVESVTDWKDGYFIFNDEDLESIMRKVARWYNVKIEYRFKPGQLYFGGMVSRDKNVSAVLKIMESTGSVHFIIQENKIIVMP
jgi:transmembrane sensor